jgi:hypothetical protein
LPTDIRLILEATYADPIVPEPPAWRELRLELESVRQKLKNMADRVTRIWVEPALDDEERVQTRHNTYPVAQLLLVRQITRQDVHTVCLDLLNGETVTASDYDWNFHTAKAIHRNLTPVPRWALSVFLPNTPAWLSNHVDQSGAVGLLQADGTIQNVANDMGLSYHPDQGIIIHRERVPRTIEEEFDESYD